MLVLVKIAKQNLFTWSPGKISTGGSTGKKKLKQVVHLNTKPDIKVKLEARQEKNETGSSARKEIDPAKIFATPPPDD